MVQRAKQRAGMKTHKKQRVAKVSPKQRKTIKTRARKLYDFLGTEKWNLVMDDETFAMLPGAQYFTKTDEETLPESETAIGMEKFGKNISSGKRLLRMVLGVRLSLQPGLLIKIFI